jgi:hypothetical protein
MTSISQAREASKRKWKAAINARWHKRVPHDMASEYVAKGWRILSTHQHFTLLIWPHEGAPT